MKFDIFNEYDCISFIKILILNEIEFKVEVLYSPVKYDDDSTVAAIHYIVEIIPKV